MKPCTVSGCQRPHKCKGLCQTHYQAAVRKLRNKDGWSEEEEKSFWAKVEKTDDCWLWTAGTDNGGYGILSVNAYPVKVHRFSWLLHNGEIPDGLGVLHRCDNRICVNPNHLFLGTTVENMLDRDAKNRQAKGEGHGRAVLTEPQVREIRKRYVSRCRMNGARALAREFGLSKSAVLSVVSGENWKGVQ